ncbi:bromodomain-containing protein, putative [Ixodes scapularis]|uniref:Bromodomain-containing protein, putative n=1 Tax=Ixodes scapularis TaxID=6945 RepID=B7Q0Y9_IXOSC|nr:bromodomain-containing protein, putative [Ixodes scapularis]|eukprot:XP_002408658.1 bromodomain-containing protein, putative [Ixodes scapularis]
MNAFEAAYPPLLPASGDTPYGSDSDGEDDVIDVLSADHCAGEHSYTMPMPPSMILEAQERRAARRPAPQPELPSLSPELSAAHRLVEWMGSPVCRKYSAPFLEPMEAEQRPAYAKVVRRPMCLSRVRASLDADEYASITEVVRDLRLILENCYRFFGPSHCFSKKAQKLETVLEQKLALLPRELREKTTLEATTLDNRDVCAQRAGRRARLSNLLPSGESSALLQLVKAEKAARAREERLKQREERKVEKEVAQQAAADWDNATFAEGLAQLSSFWEVPQVCQFLRVTQEPLQLPQAPMCELERMFLMPQKSSLLAVFMTCLLVAPQHRPKVLVQPPMPYRVWAERLRNRLQVWYRTYHGSQRNGLKVFEAHGIEEQFFTVLGDADPLDSKDYHDLTLHHRVWLFKALCDHKLGQHRRVQEWMAEQEADSLRETLLGQDREGRTYLYFPCLCEQDLRIYRQGRLEYQETPEVVPSATKKSTKEALDSWTMHYKDEEGFEESSSDESVGLGEGKDNEEDYLEEDAMEDSGWRVLRKRKIALPLTNGVADAEAVPQVPPTKEPAPARNSSSNLKRFLPANLERPPPRAKLNPEPIAVPNLLRTGSKRPIASYTVIRGPSAPVVKFSPEPAMSKVKVRLEAAKPAFRTYSQSATTGVAVQKVAKPVTSEALTSKSAHAALSQHMSVVTTNADQKANCRNQNVRTLLAAGIVNFSVPPKPVVPGRNRVASADSTAIIQKHTHLAEPATTASSPGPPIEPTTPVSRQTSCNWGTTVYSPNKHVRPAVKKHTPFSREETVYNSVSSTSAPAAVAVRNCEPTPAVAQNRVPLLELASVIPQAEGPIPIPEPQPPNPRTFFYGNVSEQRTKPVATFTNSFPPKSSGFQQTSRTTQTSKAVLVPAVDGSGQEILLHVEYSTVDEMPTNTQSFTPVTQPSVPQTVASMQNHRRDTPKWSRNPPWWKRGSCAPPVRAKDPPPLAPIAHRKIFKSRNIVAATPQCRSAEQQAEAASAECATPLTAADFMTLSGQPMLAASGSNGSQLVFLMPQETQQKMPMNACIILVTCPIGFEA